MVILFGSLASGNARPDSDLDLAVDAGHRLSAEEKQALIDKGLVKAGNSKSSPQKATYLYLLTPPNSPVPSLNRKLL